MNAVLTDGPYEGAEINIPHGIATEIAFTVSQEARELDGGNRGVIITNVPSVWRYVLHQPMLDPDTKRIIKGVYRLSPPAIGFFDLIGKGK